MDENSKPYKEALIVWWLTVVLAFLLWYRNARFDRFLCFIILIIGVINLLLYALASGANPSLVTQLIFIAIMVIPLILSIGVLLNSQGSTKLKQISFIFVILSLLAFLGALMTVFCNPSSAFSAIYCQNGNIILTRDDDSLLGLWGYILSFLVIVGFVILLATTEFNYIGIYLLIGFLFSVFLYASFTPIYWTKSLPYISTAFAFFLWFVPLINI